MSAEMLLNLKLFGPETILVGALVVLFLIDAAWPKSQSNQTGLAVTLIACLLGAVATWNVSHYAPAHFFSGLVANDGFAAFFRYFFFFVCAVGAYLSFGSKELERRSRMEFTILLLCVTFGLCLMAIATNLLILYIGIETVSIVSFVMAGFNRNDARSNEASFKYLVFGAMASGIMLYGFSLLYGYTGSLQYPEVAKVLFSTPTPPFIVLLSLVMVYAGLAYKISAFPMHFWAPDVYEGSPVPVATFFSVGPKAAGFAALLRILYSVFAVKGGQGQWQPLGGASLIQLIAFLSAATMLIGNLSALGQRNVKRMLAYSSIAHVGYMLMGLVALNAFGLQAILFYLIAYCAMNLGAFWVVSIVADLKDSSDVDAFRGIGWSMPVLGICMAVFLFSLTGIPLFSGFIGKFLLFATVLKTPGFLWLAILGVLNSVVSLYYYSKVLKAMWLDRPAQIVPIKLSFYHGLGLVGLALPTVVMGLYFTPILQFAEETVAALL